MTDKYDIVRGDKVMVSTLTELRGTLIDMNETSFTVLDENEVQVHVIIDQLVMTKELPYE